MLKIYVKFLELLKMFNTFPHEYQMDAKDCGPACLKIIAKYYGRYYSLRYLRDLCGIYLTTLTRPAFVRA